VDVDAVADELYGLALEDFIAARTAAVKQARAEGDRSLADLIGSLRKPTVAAWLTNQLVRSQRDEMGLLLDLGRELRDVMGDVDATELRELTKQRYQLVSALVQQARTLARRRGRPASDDVAQAVRATLEATLSDEESATLVAAGRLVDALQVSGFGGGGPAGRRPPPAAPSTPSAADTVGDLDAQRRRHAVKLAERNLASAQAAATKANTAAEVAAKKLEAVRGDRAERVADVERLRAELGAAEEAVETLDRHVAEAGDEADRAVTAASAADEAVEAARLSLDELEAASD
jgi:hypothetical protein